MNSHFNGLFRVPLSLLLPVVFLQLSGRFLFLGASGYCPESHGLTRGIHPVALGSKLIVEADNGHVNTERAHVRVLRELLEVVSEFLGQHWHWDVVAVFELELGCGLSEPHDHELGVVHVTHEHGADVVVHRENVGY